MTKPEITSLQHDLNTYRRIADEQAAEIERLRDVVDAALNFVSDCPMTKNGELYVADGCGLPEFEALCQALAQLDKETS